MSTVVSDIIYLKPVYICTSYNIVYDIDMNEDNMRFCITLHCSINLNEELMWQIFKNICFLQLDSYIFVSKRNDKEVGLYSCLLSMSSRSNLNLNTLSVFLAGDFTRNSPCCDHPEIGSRT